jgi:hypothetical protein
MSTDPFHNVLGTTLLEGRNMVHKKSLQQASFNQMQYLFKQKNYLQKCSNYFEEHACFSSSNTISIGKLDGFLKNMLQMRHKNCNIVLSRDSMQSLFDSNSACLEYKNVSRLFV